MEAGGVLEVLAFWRARKRCFAPEPEEPLAAVVVASSSRHSVQASSASSEIMPRRRWTFYWTSSSVYKGHVLCKPECALRQSPWVSIRDHIILSIYDRPSSIKKVFLYLVVGLGIVSAAGVVASLMLS